MILSRNFVQKFVRELIENTEQNHPKHLPEAPPEYPEIADKPCSLKGLKDENPSEQIDLLNGENTFFGKRNKLLVLLFSSWSVDFLSRLDHTRPDLDQKWWT